MKKNNILNRLLRIGILFLFFLFAMVCRANGPINAVNSAREVVQRLIGDQAKSIQFVEIPLEEGKDVFEISCKRGQLTIKGTSAIAMTYAFNRYLKEACHCMATWSGNNIHLPKQWPSYAPVKQTSPFAFRYFLNVCTFGYTMPYWNWERWEKEIDWMALHGVNMPLAFVGNEAIAERVWMRMGLSKDEIQAFFTGPSYLPWHRMGNLVGWNGPLTDQWQTSQIELQHKILKRMKELGMNPIVPAFAGFVPEAFVKKHGEISFTHLKWGGFDDKYNAYVLPPDSPYFMSIGEMFIKEWEKEFGKNKFYLSDCFNEMKLPVDDDDTVAKQQLLANYGKGVYQSIINGNPDAVWVTQGWTFGYLHDIWDEASLRALLSKVPDDRMIIIDLGNDYPKWIWHTEQTWKVHRGFYGKPWIFSYVPNFGGKTGLTGDIKMYSSSSSEALHHQDKGNLIGFGVAPEGLENNEVLYELLADMGWTDQSIQLSEWIGTYCIARYGAYPPAMRQAWDGFFRSCYSSLYSYPRFEWQTVVPDKKRISKINVSPTFLQAVESFLSCHEMLEESPLYYDDALEFSAFYIGAKADEIYHDALKELNGGSKKAASGKLSKVKKLLLAVDKLLASHPLHRLSPWISFARNSAKDTLAKDKREADAKRLITTWGGGQEDYAARFWSGLIKDYYIPRIELYFNSTSEAVNTWEEEWINTPWQDNSQPYSKPLEKAVQVINDIKCNLY